MRSGSPTGPTDLPEQSAPGIIDALTFAVEQCRSAGSWEGRIDDVIAKLGRAADVSRVLLWENRRTDDGAILRARRNEWLAAGVAARDAATTVERSKHGRITQSAGWGAWEEPLSRGEAIHGRDLGLPEEARGDLEGESIASIAVVPITTEGAWWGCLGFDECRQGSELAPWKLDALRAAAATLGAAIERQLVAERLRQTEGLYRTLVEQIPAMTFVDEVGGADEGIYVSPQIRDLLGFEPEDWYADPDFWRSHLHPEDEPEAWAAWRRSVAEGSRFSREYRMVGRDGEAVWVSERTVIVPDEGGGPARIQGVLTDITQIKETEERFRAVFEASPIGIIITGRDFRFLDANPSFCRLVGYTTDQLQTLTFADITHPDDVASDLDLARRMFAGEISSYSLEKRYLTSGGETVWANLTVTGVREGLMTPMSRIGLVEDISARKRKETRMLQAAGQAHQRLAELTRREREVLDLVAGDGHGSRQIASTLHISVRTAETHLASVYRKLRVGSRDAALAEYQRLLTDVVGDATPNVNAGKNP